MENSRDKFVFCVCGSKVYLGELNDSIRFLKHFSKNEIIVITELKRNEIPIQHDTVIDVKTPAEFTNHQATVFLKTSIHKYLDLSHRYCYLDADIYVVNEQIEDVFSYFSPPVSFAKDHVNMNLFSPYVVEFPMVKTDNKRLKQRLFEIKTSNEYQQKIAAKVRFWELLQQYLNQLSKKSWLHSSLVGGIGNMFGFKNSLETDAVIKLNRYPATKITKQLIMVEFLVRALFKFKKAAFLFLCGFLPYYIIPRLSAFCVNKSVLFPKSFLKALIKVEKKLNIFTKDKWFKANGFYSFAAQKEGREWYENNKSFFLSHDKENFLFEEALQKNAGLPKKMLLLENKEAIKMYCGSEGLALAVKEKFEIKIDDLKLATLERRHVCF